VLASLVAVVVMASACSGGGSDGGGGGRGQAGSAGAGRDGTPAPTAVPAQPDLGARTEALPIVTPTPRQARWLGPDVAVPGTVTLRAAPGVEPGTVAVVEAALKAAGAHTV
jgi:hypothetical protein